MGWVIDMSNIATSYYAFYHRRVVGNPLKKKQMLVHCDWPEFDSALIDHQLI